MFKVQNSTTKKVYTVYSVRECVGDTWFLIYIEENDVGWLWVYHAGYVPYEEPTKTNEPTYIPIPYIPYAPPTNPNDNWWTKPYITWTAQTNSNNEVTTE